MKKQFLKCEHFPLHIVGKCPYDEWPTKNLQHAWDIFGDAIHELQQEYRLQTHAFVLMSNHYHWICTYENWDEDKHLFDWFHELLSFQFFHHQMEFMEMLEDRLTYTFFEGAPHIVTLDHIESYRNAYRYVYQNPVAAGLMKSALNYPYSTISYVLGKDGLKFTCVDPMNLLWDPMKVLKFIH